MNKSKKNVFVPGGPAYVFGAKNDAHQTTIASTGSVKNAPKVQSSVEEHKNKKKDPTKAKYVDNKEMNKLIRGHLKDVFPDTKFSVKMYRGSSAIRVTWEDGPLESLVNEEIQWAKGSDFDGMMDIEVGREPVDPDSISNPLLRERMNEVTNGEMMRPLSTYVFTSRLVTDDRIIDTTEKIENILGKKIPRDSSTGLPSYDYVDDRYEYNQVQNKLGLNDPYARSWYDIASEYERKIVGENEGIRDREYSINSKQWDNVVEHGEIDGYDANYYIRTNSGPEGQYYTAYIDVPEDHHLSGADYDDWNEELDSIWEITYSDKGVIGVSFDAYPENRTKRYIRAEMMYLASQVYDY